MLTVIKLNLLLHSKTFGVDEQREDTSCWTYSLTSENPGIPGEAPKQRPPLLCEPKVAPITAVECAEPGRQKCHHEGAEKPKDRFSDDMERLRAPEVVAFSSDSVASCAYERRGCQQARQRKALQDQWRHI
ncbi:hypothetical protein PsorP6_014763 [Peronosclerospora sorghi]|uniref:Uncharacterized protein n=1 Tax=Peronosclerospora sorghi TaxID=230839 RepID=A0ACC0VQY2_9STRA|nr:hypothetical protein PsorP6_014763 [Peronosclerospora sorghi]